MAELGPIPPSVSLASTTPLSEAGAPTAGSMNAASRGDHTHPTISWRGYATTNTSGVATFDFSAKPYDIQPVPVLGYVEATVGAQPVILRVTGWTMGTGATAGKYVGCTVQAQRAQTIPTNIVTLLLGGVFNLFAASASGVSVSLVLLPAS